MCVYVSECMCVCACECVCVCACGVVMGAGVAASLDWQVLYPKGNPGLKVMSVETKMGGVPAVVWGKPSKGGGICCAHPSGPSTHEHL